MIGRVVVDNIIQDQVFELYGVEEEDAIQVLYANH